MSVRPSAVLAFVLAVPLLAAAAQNAPTSATGLEKKYEVTVGELLAMRMHQLFPVIKADSFDAPVLVQYDSKVSKIVFVILGGRDTADGAKETMDNFRRDYVTRFTAHEVLTGVTLAESDVVIQYMNRKSKRIILEHSGGQYVMK